ncbi:MAG TPA: c-type cytochrome [Bacilli bacterium]|nr:c-type cytochrome [Bacilli bacterium]
MGHDHFRDRIPGTPRHKEKDKQKPLGFEPFFPNFLLKEWIVGSLFLVAFVIWIINNPVELTDMADPNDTSFIPVPDWYFLFLYQLLKYFPGSVVWVGSVILPGIVSGLLILAPWLDNSKARHPFKRPMATWGMVLTLMLMIWMTYEAEAQHHDALEHAPKKVDPSEMPADTAIVNPDAEGAQLFAGTCAGCHGADLKGQLGPYLLGVGNKMDAAKLEETITKGFPPNMPPGGGIGDPAKIKTIAEWLSQQKQK